jgi:iron complex outermembrane receptor protein
MAQAQNRFTAVVKDAVNKDALPGAAAVVKGIQTGSISDNEGVLTVERIPDGRQAVEFSYLGYESQTHEYTFPLETNDTVFIFLEAAAGELEEVVVSTTRSTRTIENLPTRMEFIGAEELEEKGNMKPGDIRMLLSESTGIQTQQTSPLSANASVRIQGLDGRYTQILKDGLPLYSGAAGGLGLLQIPPLDLKQVEIIKGSSSTLYGGGAIAGLVNLISKTPGDRRELGFHLNGTSAAGLDVSGFYSQKFNKTGLTLFASRNSNAAYDPADIQLSAIPKFERYTVNPRLFVYFSERTTLDAGVNTTFENRLGGDMAYLQGKKDSEHSYFERNKTQRISTQFSLEHRFSDKSKLNLRNSYNHFHRVITIPGYVFDGTQNGTFSELAYSYGGEHTEWVAGANLWTDSFSEEQTDRSPLRDYSQLTSGVFVQNLTKATDWFSIETGLRGDYVVDYGFALLPRISGLFQINRKWSSRIGGGLGYKTPAIFTEESERLQYRNVLQVSSDRNQLERSYGVNADVNYRTTLGECVSFGVNQLFFYTRLNHPLRLIPQADGAFLFQNTDAPTDSRGAETNLKIGYADFKLFLGYTFTDATVNDGNGVRYRNPLTPKHRINTVLMYEVEEKWKAGLEAYYNSRQSLTDGASGQAYWVFGAMVERIWERFSVYANFENFTDTRQTRFESIYTGSVTNPVFKDIYAPLDGFVVNIGVKIRL